MPTTTTEDEPSRCGIVEIPTSVADQACLPTRVASSQITSGTSSNGSSQPGTIISSTSAASKNTQIPIHTATATPRLV